jgi:hypothetical protein
MLHVMRTNQVILWSRVILEKLTVTQPVNKFLAFYGTRRFISVFTRARRRPCVTCHNEPFTYEGVSKSFRTGSVERELQMVQLSATRCNCIAILCVSLVSFAAITLYRCCCLFRYRLSPETFGYALVQ